MSILTHSCIALAVTSIGLTLPSAALVAVTPGNETHTVSQTADRGKDLLDFVHYVWIAKPDLAKGHLQRLLDSGITNAELAQLVRETMTEERFSATVARARLVEGLGDVVADLESRVNHGILDTARDPARIKEAILLLGGTLRQQHFGEDILKEGGEYAVPYLLEYVTGGEDPTIRQRVLSVLENLGSLAVYPLSVAVSQIDEQSQVKISSILGRIGHSAAGPYLAEVAADDQAAPSVREAAGRAADRLGAGSNLATEFGSLGRRYLMNPVSFTAYPGEESNIVWSFDTASAVLIPTRVPTAIFGDVLAMALSRKALQYDGGDAGALATFIAADLKRENDLPEGRSDPVYGSSPYSADFYAMGAGPDLMQRVLDLALAMGDTPLIRDAIASLQHTAGGSNLFTGGPGSSPILRALQYPDRRVRYDAALALGKALPHSGFASDFTVVPLLAEAIRAGGASYALVVAADKEDQSTYSDWLSRKGYQVVAQVGAVGDARNLIEQSSGIDIIIVRQSADHVREAINDLERSGRTRVAPVVVFTTDVDQRVLADEYAGIAHVIIKTTPRDEGQFGNIVNEAVAKASGGVMSEGDALAYSLEAIGTLDDIAISNSAVFKINDAESALIDALNTKTGSIRLKIADVLAHVDSDSAQRALFDAALGASGSEQMDLLKRVADSAKRWGDRAEQRHVTRLLALVRQGGPVSEAAARVHGALNLSADNVVKIIAD